MSDYIFSQLEEISKDTFQDFAPYTVSQYNYNTSFDYNGQTKIDSNFYSMNAEFDSTNFEMDDIERPSEIEPQEIQIINISIQDYRGEEVCTKRISRTKLHLNHSFFGIEFIDSMKGRSATQFFASDITSIIRQSDRTGIYIQFRKAPNTRAISENTSLTFSPNDKYYDSPFNRCMYLMLEMKLHSEIDQVFQFIYRNEQLMENLRIIYYNWMLCSRCCTISDVHLITLQQQQVESNGKIQQATFVCKSSDELRSSVPTIKTKKSQFKWTKAKKSLQLEEKKKEEIKRSKNDRQQALLDLKKLHTVLPLTFNRIPVDVRNFAEKLLLEDKLKPFQITDGLCRMLWIAETNAAKLRAKSLLWELSKHPNVQISNLQAVARFLIEPNIQSSKLLPQTEIVKRKQDIPLQTVTKKEEYISLDKIRMRSSSVKSMNDYGMDYYYGQKQELPNTCFLCNIL